MNYAWIIDTLFVIFMMALSYLFYKKAYYDKLFEYFKLFILLTISAKLASFTAWGLKELNIITPDTYSILILIAFVLNMFIIYFSYQSVLKLCDKIVDSQMLKRFFAKIISVVEVIIIVTFILYICMQLTLFKRYVHPYLKQSYIYSYTKKFYTKFLDYDFVYMILSSDTNINHKEVIFKSLKNAVQ